MPVRYAPMKRCASCRINKNLSEYTKNSKQKDGLEYYCKTCRNEKEKIYRDNNKDKIKARDRQYRTNNKDKISAYQKKYHEDNKDRLKKVNSEWYSNNRDRISKNNKLHSIDRVEYSRKWRSSNRSRASFIQRTRVDRIRGASGTHTYNEWKDLCDKYGNRCLNPDCPNPYSKLSRDHVVPITRGGSNSIDNIQPLCLRCNSSKRTQTIDYRSLWQ